MSHSYLDEDAKGANVVDAIVETVLGGAFSFIGGNGSNYGKSMSHTINHYLVNIKNYGKSIAKHAKELTSSFKKAFCEFIKSETTIFFFDSFIYGVLSRVIK